MRSVVGVAPKARLDVKNGFECELEYKGRNLVIE